MRTERKHWTIRKHCVLLMEVCAHVKFQRYRGKNLLWKVFCFFFFLYILCKLKESMPGLRRRCINSGSIRGIGVHTSWSFCRRNYRRRSRCILPSPISLEHKRKERDYKHVQCNMSLAHFHPQNKNGNETYSVWWCQLMLKHLTGNDAVWSVQRSLHYSSISKETLGEQICLVSRPMGAVPEISV